MEDLQQALNWRYATKKMDPAKAVPQEKLDRILEAIRLAPTSSGLQPFEVIVVSNPEVRAEMAKAAFDQQQLVDGSHVLVFAAWDNYDEPRMDKSFDLVNEERGFVAEGWENYRNMLKGMYLPRDASVNFEHAARQTYIALGLAVTAAAFEQVDATPMEGFNAEEMDRILGLTERGLKSVSILPLGYRADEGDWLAPLKKVRKSRADLVTEIA